MQATHDMFDAHTADEAAALRPPRGFAWVFNRRANPVEFPFDGRYYQVPGHRAVLLPDVVARHGLKRTVEKIDYVNRRIQRTLSVRYHPTFGETDDPDFGKPLDAPKPVELIDRTANDSLIDERAVDGNGRAVNTSAKVISVRGAVTGPLDVGI